MNIRIIKDYSTQSFSNDWFNQKKNISIVNECFFTFIKHYAILNRKILAYIYIYIILKPLSARFVMADTVMTFKNS